MDQRCRFFSTRPCTTFGYNPVPNHRRPICLAHKSPAKRLARIQPRQPPGVQRQRTGYAAPDTLLAHCGDPCLLSFRRRFAGKKLRGSVGRWLSHGGGADEAAGDAEVFGIALDPEPDRDFAVLKANWDTVRVFLACHTQWRHGPSGRVMGLNYAGAREVARGLRIRWRQVFAGLQLMETEALQILSNRDSS